MKKIIASLILLSSLKIFGYIPPSRFIIEQTVKKNPVESLHFETEVTLSKGVDLFKIKERWYLSSDNNFHVSSQGLGNLKDLLSLDIIYSGGKKHLSIRAQKLTQPASFEMAEKLMKINSVDRFSSFFEKLNILPKGSLRKKIFSSKNNEYSYEVESFVRLSRALGLPSYLLKVNPYSQEEEPALWIEQDRFAVKKIRLPSGATVELDSYVDFEKSFHLPQKITYSWGGSKAVVKIIPISSKLANKFPIKNPDLLISSLEESKSLELLNVIPGSDLITEFYSRFR